MLAAEQLATWQLDSWTAEQLAEFAAKLELVSFVQS